MKIDRGKIGFLALAVVLSAVFVRLGIWQLDRRAERLDRNEARLARLAQRPVSLGAKDALRGLLIQPAGRTGTRPGESPYGAAASREIEQILWRRVEARGVYDLGREIILRARTFRGSPGVELLTPLVLASEESEPAPAVLVKRGWLPASDGLRPELADARPPPRDAESKPSVPTAEAAEAAETADSSAEVRVRGIALPGARGSETVARRYQIGGRDRLVVQRIDLERVAAELPYRVAGFYLLATQPGVVGPALQLPSEPGITSGPHMAYAIQWFAFAAIAIVGSVAYVSRGSRRRRPT